MREAGVGFRNWQALVAGGRVQCPRERRSASPALPGRRAAPRWLVAREAAAAKVAAAVHARLPKSYVTEFQKTLVGERGAREPRERLDARMAVVTLYVCCMDA